MSKTHVLLLDATVATGAAAMMAIRVLLDHDVPEENIFFLTLIAATTGAYDSSHDATCALTPVIPRRYPHCRVCIPQGEDHHDCG